MPGPGGPPDGPGHHYGVPMTTPEVAELLDRARTWAAEDPDDRTRAELEAIVADVTGGADAADLADRFDGTLEFGTAGLRGDRL